MEGCPTPLISLENLRVAGVSPTELVDVAADTGYDAISPFAGGSPCAYVQIGR